MCLPDIKDKLITERLRPDADNPKLVEVEETLNLRSIMGATQTIIIARVTLHKSP